MFYWRIFFQTVLWVQLTLSSGPKLYSLKFFLKIFPPWIPDSVVQQISSVPRTIVFSFLPSSVTRSSSLLLSPNSSIQLFPSPTATYFNYPCLLEHSSPEPAPGPASWASGQCTEPALRPCAWSSMFCGFHPKILIAPSLDLCSVSMV